MSAGGSFSVLDALLVELDDAFRARYPPTRILGRGAFGAAYLAHDQELDRDVVVKIVEFPDHDATTEVRRFREEGLVLSRLQHPNLLRLLDYGADARVGYLVHPYEGGRDLAAWLDEEHGASPRRPLPPDLAVPILRGVLAGLGHAHAEGVVHRDVKPANVLRLDDGQVRLLDFGLARRDDRTQLTATMGLVGTPIYLSPQVIQGERAGPSDDLYAVGVMAYELLSGEVPFRGGGIAQILNRQLSYTPPPLDEEVEGVSPHLARWVERLLAKTAELRPRSAEAALDLLEESTGALVRTQEEVTAPLAGPASEEVTEARALPPPAPRRGRIRLAAGLVVAGLLGGWLLSGQEAGPPPERLVPSDGAVSTRAPHRLAGLRDRLRRDLEALEARVRRGKAGALRFPSEDPHDWRGLVDRVPALAEVAAHLRSPAALAPPSAERVAEAEAADGVLAGFGISGVLAPLLSVRPEEGEVHPARGDDLGGRPVHGWLAAAVRERRALVVERARRTTELAAFLTDEGPPPPGEAFGRNLRAFQIVSGRSDPTRVLRTVVELLNRSSPLVRVEVRSWAREVERRAVRFVACVARAVQEGGESAERAVTLLGESSSLYRGFVVSTDLLLGPEALLAGEPETDAEHALAALYLTERNRMLTHFRGLALEPRHARVLEHALRGLAGERSSDAARARVARTFVCLLKTIPDAEVTDQVVDVTRRALEVLARHGTDDLTSILEGGLRTVLYEAGGRPAVPGRVRAEVLEAIRGVAPGAAEELASLR